MATATVSTTTIPEHSAVELVAGETIPTDYLHGLSSKWPEARDLAGSNLPCRFEGEIADLVVLGEIPKEIKGTFYRVMCDPFRAPVPGNVPLDGDGNISAFRIHDGRVDMKMAYVKTERYMLERAANKALFGLYRNPYTHHPCVRSAIDSTANTNLVYWADRLLALKESALPYSVDPDTLETIEYDPFGEKSNSKAFTGHPKIDPFTEELVVFGYQAKGLATRDIVAYTLNKEGKKVEELWTQHRPMMMHDCAITENWLIVVCWPFETSLERLKAGKHHWAYDYNLKATFIVIPRRKTTPLPRGWELGETRFYEWENCVPIHTAGAWETADGKIHLESSRVHDNNFPFFPTVDGKMPGPETKGDFVRWELDLSQPTGSKIASPQVILDVACEFPRIDERFMSKQYEWVVMDAFMPNKQGNDKNIYHGLNALAMHNHTTGETRYFYAGDNSLVQEPIFIPRSDSAPEGDGWVMAMVERRDTNTNDLVLLDTKEFEKPVAIIRLPMHVKAQVHGNWVQATETRGVKGLVQRLEKAPVSGLGSLEPLSSVAATKL